MEITADVVDSIEETRQVVEYLLEHADEHEQLDGRQLYILERQLDALHQALAVGYADKQHGDDK